MVKGPARNAQYYFITEYVMPKYNFRSFMDALSTGRSLWKNLTDEEKAPYKQKEKDWKAYMRGPAGDKYRKNCQGENMQESFDKEKQKEAFEEEIDKAARDYIDPENLDKPYFFIHFEYALQDDYHKFYPVEVALVKYSLRKGIEKTMHYFLHPGEYPLGTKAAAKKWCEERHKIPFMSFDKWTQGYSAVFAHMRDIILNTTAASASGGTSGGYPPLYSMPDYVMSNRGCLDTLFKRADRQASEEIHYIASATHLLIKLFGEGVCGQAKALEILGSTTFDHEQGVACDWHYEQEVVNCSLAFAKKIGFALSESLCQRFELPLTPSHLPTVSTLPDFQRGFSMMPYGKGKNSYSKAGSTVGSVVSTTAGSEVSMATYCGMDSVVSGPDSSRFAAMSMAPAGRGRSFPVPPSRSDVSMASNDGGWTQVKSKSSQGWNKAGASGTWDDDDDDTWQTVSDPRHKNRGQSAQSGWAIAASRSAVSAGQYDDDDDWEASSVASSSVRMQVQPSGSASSTISYSNATRAAIGRGRGGPAWS